MFHMLSHLVLLNLTPGYDVPQPHYPSLPTSCSRACSECRKWTSLRCSSCAWMCVWCRQSAWPNSPLFSSTIPSSPCGVEACSVPASTSFSPSHSLEVPHGWAASRGSRAWVSSAFTAQSTSAFSGHVASPSWGSYGDGIPGRGWVTSLYCYNYVNIYTLFVLKIDKPHRLKSLVFQLLQGYCVSRSMVVLDTLRLFSSYQAHQGTTEEDWGLSRETDGIHEALYHTLWSHAESCHLFPW